MAAKRSLLQSMVNGTRRVLGLQVLLGVVAIALTAWTLDTVDNAMSERTRLADRVIQLEEALASSGIVVPPPAPVVLQAEPTYPPHVGAAAGGVGDSRFDPRRAIGDLFSAPPPITEIVLHVRGENDLARAKELLAGAGSRSLAQAAVALMPPGDVRAPGYFYFDGRQSASAADLVSAFNNAARRAEIAPWSAQLRGTALPARGEFAAERLDLILPELPPPPPPPPPSPVETAPPS